MTAFCVRGVTMEYARNVAATFYRDKQFPDEDSYLEKLKKKTIEIYENSSGARLSGDFDAPQFAEEFKHLTEKTSKGFRDLVVMVRVRKRNKNGFIVKKKGTEKPVMVWFHIQARLMMSR